ncbi:hypothetical protein Y032_0380g341 [Ancylostoma ceylanicum]|nr:hypothetical protein Y032_0380g341 [Ancylostoma ceylanicum]
MKKIFARFGNPQTLVTGNETQFTSAPFLRFCRSRGITHVRSPPFQPQFNGQAERFVDTFTRGLAELKGEEPTGNALLTFLMFNSMPIWTKILVASRKLPGTQTSHRARLDQSVSRRSRWTTRRQDGSSLQPPPWSTSPPLRSRRCCICHGLPRTEIYLDAWLRRTPHRQRYVHRLLCRSAYGTATSTNYGHEAALLQSTNFWTCSICHCSAPEPIPTTRRQKTQRTFRRRLFNAPHANAERQTDSTLTQQRRRTHSLKGEVL